LPLDEARLTRKAFIEAMHRQGVGVGISYEALHLASAFREHGCAEGRFPVSERIARETVTLPLYPEMNAGDVERVCSAMSAVLRGDAR
jgi:dTDP-4-amino-4,6-dideoxygalactose transaminase